MSIAISNLTVSSNAPTGTVIGVLTALDPTGSVIPCTYTLTKASAGYFTVSGNALVTAWSTSAAPGSYSVRMHAIGTNASFSGSATFTINVVVSPEVTVNGSANAAVAVGSTLSVAITGGPSDPTDWVGWALASAPQDSGGNVGGPWVFANGTQTASTTGESAFTISLAGPTAAGSYLMRFFANNSYTLLASCPFTAS